MMQKKVRKSLTCPLGSLLNLQKAREHCGFNCSRSSLESHKECNTGQFMWISCRNPYAWDSSAHLGQMHLFGLMQTYWRTFNCRNSIQSRFSYKPFLTKMWIWRPMQKSVSTMHHIHWDTQYNIKGDYSQVLLIQHK